MSPASKPLHSTYLLTSCCSPETTGRELAEIDVIFAHAHLAERRPTLIADELPKLTGNQIEKLHERYDIHGPADNVEAPQRGDENIDLSLPPPESNGATPAERSPATTRVPSINNGNEEKAKRV